MKTKITIEPIGDDGFHVFCNVKINKYKCRALIDTGASKSVVSLDLKERLNLPEYFNSNDNIISGIQPGKLDVNFVLIDKISFGKFDVLNIISGIIDIEHINEQYKTLGIKPFDLILGGDVLSKSNAIINYKLKIIEVS